MKKRLHLSAVIMGLLLLLNLPALAAPPQQDSMATCVEEYTVQANDWLSKLSERYLNDIFAYPAIVEATNQKHATDDTFAEITNPDLIEVGWKLCIPAASDAAAETAETMAESHNTDADAEAEDDSHGEAPHWSYQGDTGPAAWGSLDEAFASCDIGLSQSPIDITAAVAQDLVDIQFNYQPSSLNIVNNGHTIQVNYDPGSYIMLNNVQYNLLQFHFHTPSEHTIDGAFSDLEIHLVHANADGGLAVVGAMMKAGAENATLQAVWNRAPATEGPEEKYDQSINVEDLLPAGRLTYRYSGSLTTPPCSEGVNWNVLTDSVEVSADQVAAFQSLFSANNRPVQPLNDREIAEDTTTE
jgi:carbonic anhydrase